MKITELFIYPIKSCPGISIKKAIVQQKGLDLDRRYMIVDGNGKFITQREFPILSQITLAYHDVSQYMLEYNGNSLLLPIEPGRSSINASNPITISLWNDKNIEGMSVFQNSEKAHTFFSTIIGKMCYLVWADNSLQRPTRLYDVGFADGYHSLLISQTSIDMFNSRLPEDMKVSSKHFRPNIMFDGITPHGEDDWVTKDILIGDTVFFGNKLCARCSMITVDPETGKMNPKIFGALAQYRFKKEPEKGAYFGLNISPKNIGEVIQVGDELSLL